MNKNRLFLLFLGLSASCTPLKTSSKDEKHQMELTLHEIQTNLDDLRHDVHCFQTDTQILDGKIKHHENALSGLKQGYLEKQEQKIDDLNKQINEIEKRIAILVTNLQNEVQDIKQLTSHANETTTALIQYKERINELEKQLLTQDRKFDEIVRLKGTLETLAKAIDTNTSKDQIKIYRVKAGDSLEKIAKAHKTNVDYLKKINSLQQDLIVVDQEIKVPQKE